MRFPEQGGRVMRPGSKTARHTIDCCLDPRHGAQLQALSTPHPRILRIHRYFGKRLASHCVLLPNTLMQRPIVNARFDGVEDESEGQGRQAHLEGIAGQGNIE